MLEGGVTRNKGDELMMLAAVHHLTRVLPDIRFARPLLADAVEDRQRLGFAGALWPPGRWSVSGTLGYLMLKRYAAHLGLVTASEISAVFNVSGYSYGQLWGDSALQSAAENVRYWSRRAPVFFMPQSFGPFESRREGARRNPRF